MGERLHTDVAGDRHSERRDGQGSAPGNPVYAQVLRLQRIAGNRAVGRLAPRLLARQPSGSSGGLTSKLIGRKRQLDWDGDYKGTPDPKSPFEALTKTGADVKVGGAIPGESSFEAAGSSFKLKDSVVVTVDVDRNKCWKKASVDNAPDNQRKLLLEHEQGHYDIAALIARDMFIEIMALKSRTFATRLDGSNELRSIINRHAVLASTVDALYDSSGETGHTAIEFLSFGPPRKPAAQAKWEGYIRRAFTEERSPQVTAPDGATYKITLASVLRGAGHSV
jgi:hypothetical protein